MADNKTYRDGDAATFTGATRELSDNAHASKHAIVVGTSPTPIDPRILTALPGQKYETVAASQTAQVLGGSGAVGDLINGILVVPATTSPGNVLLLDNATSMTVFTGGSASVSNLVPFFIPLGIVSGSGAWKITSGANVSCIAVGNFT